MTLALTAVKAYAIEASAPIQSRFVQKLVLEVTGANTDTVWDIGNFTGTFWTAVGGTAQGAAALKALKSILPYAKAFLYVSGRGMAGKAEISGSGGGSSVIDSNPSVGGSATEALTFTGLAVGDTVYALTPKTVGANNVTLRAFGTPALNSLSTTFTGDPGAGAVVRAHVRKGSGAATPVAGQVVVAMDPTNIFAPNLTFATGDAPLTACLVLEWELSDAGVIVEVKAP